MQKRNGDGVNATLSARAMKLAERKLNRNEIRNRLPL